MSKIVKQRQEITLQQLAFVFSSSECD